VTTVHSTTLEEIKKLAVQQGKPRSPYDDLLDAVAQGQPMRIEGSDSKELRGTKIAISRLAKRRDVPIVYLALTNGFAVLLDESTAKPKGASTRQRRTRQHHERRSPSE